MDWLADPTTWIAFLTLVALELVLGVDNVIFISILAGKLPAEQQQRARTTGIMLAVLTRIFLLLSLSWIISLTEPLFILINIEISGRDIVLIAGGLFLLWKSVHEIHQKLEGEEGHASAKVRASFWSVIIQILLLDIVFSLDSVITAVGMVDEIAIMIAAVVIAASVMVFTAAPLSSFVEKHPTIKMLALSFLLLIGFTLIVEGLHQHIPKGYIYFAMGFSVLVEMLNLRLRAKAPQPVSLHEPYKETVATGVAAAIANVPMKTSSRKISSDRTESPKPIRTQAPKENIVPVGKSEVDPEPSDKINRRVDTKREIESTNKRFGEQVPVSRTRPLRVFLCHASQDKPAVRELYRKLKQESWIDPWLDEEKLLPGQDWDLEIYKNIRIADAILVCLSTESVSKQGYVQREFKRALDLAEEKPEGSIYIIPLRFDNCEPPFRFKQWQWLDYFSRNSHARLLQSLNSLETKD